MKTVQYYLGLAVCPLLFVVILFKRSCKALHRAFTDTVVETREAIASHKRYFGKR